jgi:Uma2 family endonuclease
MVAVPPLTGQLTLEEFLACPETQPACEYVEGKVRQKPMPQGEHSTLQIRLGMAINEVAVPEKLAHGFTELRCTFSGRSIVPDIAVFAWSRIPRTERGRIANCFDCHPDWVIEILSPEQSANQVIEKILYCLNAGTRLGWLIDPQDESVMVLQPDGLPQVRSGVEPLPVLEELGRLNLSAQQVFAWLVV